jgi:hypothetical protein
MMHFPFCKIDLEMFIDIVSVSDADHVELVTSCTAYIIDDAKKYTHKDWNYFT